MRLENGRKPREEGFSVKAFAISGLTVGTAFFADRYGINFAVQHGLTPETGVFAAKNTNNLWDTLMISVPGAFLIFDKTKNKAKQLSNKAVLGISALSMIPGIVCNVASEVPAINSTYVMQHDVPEVFRSEPGTINPYHAVDGGIGTLAVEGMLYGALRRRTREITVYNSVKDKKE
jgi:hypothetical protein